MNLKYRLVISPWKREFVDLVSGTRSELFMSSPFVNLEGVTILSNSIQMRSSVRVSLITNLRASNIVNGVTDPAALLKLHDDFGHVEISSLGRLHAKVYLVDNEIGIVTSANLTGGGLTNNLEYGVLIRDKKALSAMKNDMSEYYSLGNILDRNLMQKIAKEASRLRAIQKTTRDLTKNTELAKELKRSIEAIDFELLRNRTTGGRTVNAIFAETILYILGQKGPLKTEEIHPLVQSMHPDFCDESIDRIIHGQHFGKRWKHLVRDAQQFLKKKGLIHLRAGKWCLVT